MCTTMIAQPARKIWSIALTITMLGLISACSSQPRSQAVNQSRPVQAVNPHSVGERAAVVALNQVGVPYRYGGSTTSGFDCSGLIQYSYLMVGKRVPRTTGQLWRSTKAVRRENIRVGDLLFFSIEGKMSHVGMYIGGQRFVHAPSTGRTVSVASLDSPYYSAAFIRAGRPK